MRHFPYSFDIITDTLEQFNRKRVVFHGLTDYIKLNAFYTDRRCERVGGVHGVLTLICGGEAQTCHDDRVVELKEQLVVEEVDGEGQEGKVKEEGRGRVKEIAPWICPWMTKCLLRT